jgi:hypothetical protein
MKLIAIIVAVIGLGALAAPARPSAELLNTAVQTPARVAEVLAASATEHEAAQAVAQVIWMIQNGPLSDEEKKDRIAMVVGESVRILGDKAADFIGPLAERLNLELLPVVTAAAVVSAGPRSPEVLAALIKVAGRAAPTVTAVRTAASNPVAVLGAPTAAALPIAAPVVQSASSVESSSQPVTSTSASGSPAPTGAPRPPGMAPRPPAMPYRGQ